MNCDVHELLGSGLECELEPVAEAPGIAAFFIAASAIDGGLRTTLIELLEDQGHEALLVANLDRRAAEAAGYSGYPTVVVTIDLLPMKVDGAKYPGFDNPKIPKALERARHLTHELLPGVSDALAATCSSREAWDVVRLIFPDEEEDIRKKADGMRSAFATDGALADLTREGRRAKVELIQFDGAPAIRKTYRPAALRYMEREIEVLERLSAIRPELPTLLHRTANAIIVSYIEGGRDLLLEHRGGRPTPLPLDVVRALADFIKGCVAEGFDPVDLRAPGNAMLSPDGLKVIDSELWRRCSPETRPENALCVAGAPPGDTERPRGVPAFGKPYSVGWYPLTLLSIESFLYDPAWLQRLKRQANLLRIWAARGATVVERRLRKRLGSKPRTNPRFIPVRLGVDGVIAELNRRNVRYVVLRWFDRLPALPAGGDLDLLVHDDDIAEVDRVLDDKSGIAECDVYSVSGLPGTTYSGVPHLPPARAADLLASAVLVKGSYPAPTAEHHFLSLAFHAVFHKGFKTGMPSRHAAPADIPKPKNDYLGTLASLAAELGIPVELTLEGLERFLARSGWTPTPQMLAALSHRNVWIQARFGDQSNERAS
jgi:hypothetical protein